MMGRLSVSSCAVLMFSFALWTATTETAHGRLLRKREEKCASASQEEIKQFCLPPVLPKVDFSPRATGVHIRWSTFSIRHFKCKCNARYEVLVKWTPQYGNPQLEEIGLDKKGFEIKGLTPWTAVEITVEARYTDASKKVHYGGPTTRKIITVIDKPSEPTNFKRDTVTRTRAKLVWNSPKDHNGPLDGYFYKLCKVKSCEDEHTKTCDEAQEMPQSEELHLTRLESNQFYWVELAAFNILQVSREILNSTHVHTCFQTLPPSPIRPTQFKAECKSNPNNILLTWTPPSGKGKVQSYEVGLIGVGKPEVEPIKREVEPKVCQDEKCKYSVDGLKGDTTYEVTLIVHGDHPDDEDSVFAECTMTAPAGGRGRPGGNGGGPMLITSWLLQTGIIALTFFTIMP